MKGDKKKISDDESVMNQSMASSSTNASKWKKLKSPIKGAKKKGKKVLRIFKGGKSRTEEKKEPEGCHELVATNEGSSRSADVSGAYDLQSNAPSPQPNNAIRVALLLMDPKSRRFEFLMCDLDQDEAIVEDVLSFIKESALEEVFHEIEFSGVASCSGKELISRRLMKQYVTSPEVLVAIPKGSNSRACVDMALPILLDETVIGVLQSQNFQCPLSFNRISENRCLESSNLTTSEDDTELKIVPTTTKKKRGAVSLLVFSFIPVLFAILFFYSRLVCNFVFSCS